MKYPNFIHLIPILLAMTYAGPVQGDTPVLDRMRSFNAVIDSLSIEKEARIRAGRQFDELDAQVSLYRDSMVLCRNSSKVGQRSQAAAAPAVKLPANPIQSIEVFFGNFVLVIGAGVSISILLFAVFFVISWMKQRKRNAGRRSAMPAKTGRRDAEAWPEAETFGIPEPMRMPLRMPGLSEEVVELSTGSPEARPPISPISVEEPVREGLEPVLAEALLIGDLNQQVVEAARQGMSARDISKRYRISTDQVALQLALAGQQARR